MKRACNDKPLRQRPGRPVPSLVFIFLGLLGTMFLLVSMSPIAIAQDTDNDAEFGAPVAGQRIYDLAGVFSDDERIRLEAEAAAVEQAGSPVAVYYRLQDADYDETVDDGNDLMEEWDVQTSSGARDGIVIFINAEPDDSLHGEFALIAGEILIDGNLPQYELERIDDEMGDLLSEEQIADAITLGLREITRDLTLGPPPPPEPNAFEQFAIDATDGPFSITNIISTVLAIPLLVWVARRIPGRKRARPGLLNDAPIGLQPAQAGALTTGMVSDAQMLGTIVDLAGRGTLVIKPEDSKGKKAHVQLLDGSGVRGEVEERVWESLAAQANSNGTISSKELGKVRGGWRPAKEALEHEMHARGWFDPTAGERRKPLYALETILLVLAFVPFILLAVAEQFWGLIGTFLLVGAALFAFVVAVSIPNTTLAGDTAADPWRSYQHTMKESGKRATGFLDLDRDMPFAVAMGVVGSLDKQLKAASNDGYVPTWLTGSGNLGDSSNTVAFYPVWIAFNSSVTPTSSTGNSSSASSGSGSASGSF